MLLRSHVFLPSLMVLSLAGILGSSQAQALSPPWILLQNQVKATIGDDSYVHVDDLKEVSQHPLVYDLNIHVFKDWKAHALAAFMTQDHDFGGVYVHVRVLDRDGKIEPGYPVPSDPKEAEKLIGKALGSNYYFVKVDPARFYNQLFIEFSKEVVQYFADNISDYYQNNNEVAAAAFYEVLDLDHVHTIHIGVATSPHDNDDDSRL